MLIQMQWRITNCLVIAVINMKNNFHIQVHYSFHTVLPELNQTKCVDLHRSPCQQNAE